MANIKSKSKQNPRLQQAELSDGRASLYLEFYLGRSETPVLDENGNQVLYTDGAMAGKPKFKVKHIRKKEILNLYIWLHPRNAQERLQNKNTLAMAENIRHEREQKFLENREGYRFKKDRDINFLDFFQDYLDNYKKANHASMKTALTKFKRFLHSSSQYSMYSTFIKPEQLTKEMMQSFADYLAANGKGEGPAATLQCFKRVIHYAMDKDLIKKDPCKGIVIPRDENILRKEILTMEEIDKLMATKYDRANPEVQRGFAFTLFTGIRMCDIRTLTYGNVDYSSRILRFQQNKTKSHSGNSWVVIPLNDNLLTLIGQPSAPDKRDERIFKLPTKWVCQSVIRHWVKCAGISKHITWHCARHSFAVNILNAGANIKTVASLLGHSGLKHTEKYTRAIDSLKQDAINSLGNIDFDRVAF